MMLDVVNTEKEGSESISKVDTSYTSIYRRIELKYLFIFYL